MYFTCELFNLDEGGKKRVTFTSALESTNNEENYGIYLLFIYLEAS